MAQKKFIIDGGFQTNADSVLTGNLDMTGNINMTGHIIPTVDSDGTTGYDLGTPEMKWRDLYLSQGSLYIDGQKVLESDAGTIVVKADEDQSLTTKVTGTGVLTMSSETTINIDGTLQMGSGKNITSADGNAVQFGDKLDMNNNEIVEVGAPTAATSAATKGYVDTTADSKIATALAGFAQNAITESDSNVTINDAGTGNVVFTVDGATRMTVASAGVEVDSLAIGGVAAATTADVSSAVSAEETRATGAESTLQSNIDAEETRALAAEGVLQDNIDAEEAARVGADAALSTRIDNILENTDATALNSLSEIVSAFQVADQNLDGAITTLAANAATDATDKADAAEAAAISSAKDYTDGRETAITTAYTSAIATAKSQAISAAATDATTKADAAEAAAVATANTYTDTSVANLIASAPGALDTLNELAAALGDDANFASTVTNNIATAKSQAISAAATDATTKADAAEAAAISTAEAYTDSIMAIEHQHHIDGDAFTLSAANLYTDGRETAITTAYQAYADQAEADAEAYAKSYTDGRETAITTAYTSAIATAKSQAISAAASDATSKANAAQANASADASAKANTAETNAKSYADTKVANLINGAGSAYDTLKELQNAIQGNDADLTSLLNLINSTRTSAVQSFTTFHVRGANFTDAEETANLTGNITRTVAELASAVHFDVYINRVLLRGPEAGADAEYTVSGTTISFLTGVIASSDNLDIRGFSVSTIA